MNNHWRVVVRVGLALVLGFGAIRSTDAAGMQVLTLSGTVTNSSGQCGDASADVEWNSHELVRAVTPRVPSIGGFGAWKIRPGFY